jgi:hypothetical protein
MALGTDTKLFRSDRRVAEFTQRLWFQSAVVPYRFPFPSEFRPASGPSSSKPPIKLTVLSICARFSTFGLGNQLTFTKMGLSIAHRCPPLKVASHPPATKFNGKVANLHCFTATFVAERCA